MENQRGESWLFEVEEVFDLSGPGFLIVGNLKPSGAVITVGDAVVILCPDGHEVITRIKSIPMIRFSLKHRDAKGFLAFELPKGLNTTSITAGSQVFRKSPDD